MEAMDTDDSDDFTLEFSPGFKELMGILDEALTSKDLRELIERIRDKFLGHEPQDCLPSQFLQYLANQHPESDCFKLILNALESMNFHTELSFQSLADDIRDHVYVGPKEIFGREKIIGELVDICTTRTYKGIWLYGSGGLGKTTVAEEVCQRLHHSAGMEIIRVHLNRVQHIDHVMNNILKSLHETTANNDIDLVMRLVLQRLRGLSAKTILMLDSVEALQENHQSNYTFGKFVSEFLNEDSKVTLMITSRLDMKLRYKQNSPRQVFDDQMKEIQLPPLTMGWGTKLLQMLSKHTAVSSSHLKELAIKCKCSPHSLRKAAGALRDSEGPDSIQFAIRRSAVENMQYIFDRLSRSLQEQVIMLSVFETTEFNIRDVCAILYLQESQAETVLKELANKQFIQMSNENQILQRTKYSFHHLDFDFLDNMKSTKAKEAFCEQIATADVRFYERFMMKIAKYVGTFQTEFAKATSFILRNSTRLNLFFRIICSGNKCVHEKMSLHGSQIIAHIPSLLLQHDKQLYTLDRLIFYFQELKAESQELFWMVEKANTLLLENDNARAEQLLSVIRPRIDCLKGDELTLIGTKFYQVLARASRRVQKYEDALTFLNNAEQLNENNRSESERLIVLANIFNTIGNVFFDKKCYDICLEYHQKAVETRKQQLKGAKHHELSTFIFNVGTVARAKAEYESSIGNKEAAHQMNERAIIYFNESLDMAKDLQIDRHPDFATKLTIKEKALVRLDRFEEATECLNEALEIRKDIYGQYHRQVTLLYYRLGELHFTWRNHLGVTPEGREHLKKAIGYFADAEKNMLEGGFLIGDDKLKFITMYESLAEVARNEKFRKRVSTFCQVLREHDNPMDASSDSDSSMSSASMEEDDSGVSDPGIDMEEAIGTASDSADEFGNRCREHSRCREHTKRKHYSSSDSN